ncbi:glycosyltransferase family 4 protein [Massilia sp. LXY-6]|uniref:glycosyltransferase family 4 protein n=1 Tax=Massilia sp. LXY-6 TaxID=3379823 RepID=UPI003EE09DC4
MKNKIIQVIGNGDPGGGTTAVLTLATMLRDAGHEPVVVSQRGSYLLEQAGGLGIAVHGLDFSSRGGAIANCAALAAFIRRQAPAVVHAHGNRAGLPVMLALRLLGRGARPRFVYTVHGFHFLSKKPVAFHLARLAERFCIGRADWTNFVSQGDAQIAREHRLADISKTRVIHNAVLASELPALPPQRTPGNIAFIGRLMHQKNPLILADIVAALGPRAPCVHVIGGGELEPELQRKVSSMGLGSHFVFHGQQPRPAALSIAAGCSLLLLPSRWEGHPITVIEAMHMGLPVIASDISGTREIVRDGESGYLLAAEDVSGYAAAIARVLADPVHARRLGEAGRVIAQKEFSPQRMLEANLDAYRLAA